MVSIKNFIPKIHVPRKLLKARLKVKISIYYILVLVPALLALFFSVTGIDAAIIRKQTLASAGQTLSAVDKNYGYILQNVYQFSDYLYFDSRVQEALRFTQKAGINPQVQEVVNRSLINMIISSRDIASAYLIDNYGNCYSMSKLHNEEVNYGNLSAALWYKKVIAAKGTPVWILDGGSIIRMKDGSRPLSLARVINDTTTYKPLGFLLINIDVNNLKEHVGSGDVFLIDSSGKCITSAAGIVKSDLTSFPSFAGKTREEEKVIGGKYCAVVSMPSSYGDGWTLIGVLPVGELSQRYRTLESAMLLIIPVAVLILLAGQSYITRLVTNPLANMRGFMTQVQHGIFELMPVDEIRDDEIVQLKRVFNLMVKRIKALIERVTREQKQLRKSELATMRAQINPHFLYNTLDAVSALSLIGDNKSAFELTQALGHFYRVSLSSGREVITVKEEIRCIQDYVTIMNIRYKGIFHAEYEIAPEIFSLPVLKLILQPFVENAIGHGLKGKDGGHLSVRGWRDRKQMTFQVRDDGVGMPQEKAKRLLHTARPEGKGGFGVYSSIVRISLFYGVKNPVHIESKEGEGTGITIRIPVLPQEPSVDFPDTRDSNPA